MHLSHIPWAITKGFRVGWSEFVVLFALGLKAEEILLFHLHLIN